MSSNESAEFPTEPAPERGHDEAGAAPEPEGEIDDLDTLEVDLGGGHPDDYVDPETGSSDTGLGDE